MPRGRPRKKPSIDSSPDRYVFDIIWSALIKRNQKPLASSLMKRVKDLLGEASCPEEAALVCLTIIDDSHDFSTWKDFNWVFYEYTRDSLEVPDGAWRYALWSYELHSNRDDNKKLVDSIDYWLGVWCDAEEDAHPLEVLKAKESLEKLWKVNQV